MAVAAVVAVVAAVAVVTAALVENYRQSESSYGWRNNLSYPGGSAPRTPAGGRGRPPDPPAPRGRAAAGRGRAVAGADLRIV